MGKNKYIYKPKEYEVRCCGVQVFVGALDEIKLTGNWEHDSNPENFDSMVDEETKKKLLEPTEIAKQMGYFGAIPNLPHLIILFKDNEGQKALDYYKKMTELKYDVKLVKNALYVDSRYLQGDFAGKLTTLPPDYIDKAIRELFDKYGDEIVITDDPVKDTIIYSTDLGGREIHAIICGGDKMLSIGMTNGMAFSSVSPTRDYKRMLADFEQIIIAWRKDHPGLTNGA